MKARQPLLACEHCASLYVRPRLNPGESALCRRCGAVLWRASALGVSHWLALTITTAIVFALANTYPLASVVVQGLVQQTTLFEAIAVTWRQGQWLLALMTGLGSLLLPLCQIVLLLWLLASLVCRRRPRGFALATRLLGFVQPWCMVPVFLLGVVVAIVKLAAMTPVAVGPGLIAFALLTVLLTMLGRLSPPVLWRYAEVEGVAAVHVPAPDAGPPLCACETCAQVQAWVDDAPSPQACLRCGTPLHPRKPDSLARTWALLLAATILYIPANMLPMMHVFSLREEGDYTILGGVIKLWQSGSWDIALIVFVASVVVPLIKLLTLAILAVGVHRSSRAYLRQRRRLYVMLDLIGQWSMLDLFVVIVLAALARFQGLMAVRAETGAAVFGLVVILTMLAAMSFDPRRAWDVRRPRPIAMAPLATSASPCPTAAAQLNK